MRCYAPNPKMTPLERLLALFRVVVCFDCKTTVLEEHAWEVPGGDYLCDKCRPFWRDHWN